MVLNIFIFLLYFNLLIQEKIKNGVYNILVSNLYLYNYKRQISLTDKFIYPHTFFRIKNVLNDKNESFYNIEKIDSNYKITLLEGKSLNISRNKNDSNFWKFIEIKENSFIIQNKKTCFMKIKNMDIFCDTIPLDEASIFELNKIYFEVDNSKYNITLLKNEPIDVLIKYIDLRDPNLNRKGIHQIEKDYDNEELRYSIRSILNNIPWIRKIFILMPNERVRYLKEYNLIKERIVYVKDKDLLGYDSSNIYNFLFKCWKMKKFGISDNIIVMDDDFFIGKKIEKKDFFHIEKGKVVPSIITSRFDKLDIKHIKDKLIEFESKAKQSKEEQNGDIFNYGKFLTLSFIFQLFNIPSNESIFLPFFTHNAIPINLKEVKEIYDKVYHSKYRYTTLDCKYRHIELIQFHIFYNSYTFLKYNRPVRHIPFKFIQLNDSILSNFKYYSLLCINKGAGNYSYLKMYNAKILMEYLFPNPSPYEIVDYSLLNISFNATYTLNRLLKLNEKEMSHFMTKKVCFYLLIKLILIFLFILFKEKFRYKCV